ncbi:serine O-acetyltransferase [Roseivirga misakiensis]|uniref:Serine acetyltransferase n=1 Tax=Roseivirga misakiensis TaxID=1563681 RepID=A0A1E5SYC7_9BACT|nr:serine acetyltransferase [Roseivirga misakiensis]OEK04116.1 serine acetyltransferase [Roseivirga misakiensis]
MNRDFINSLYVRQQVCLNCASPETISEWFNELLGTLFPDFSKQKFNTQREFELHLEKLKLQLEQILSRNETKPELSSSDLADLFFDALPEIHSQMEQDVTAIFEGDPAAKSRTEVIRTYPGFMAIAAHRIAHQLDILGISLIPRIISEFAHSKTGIDIHPSAQIGNFFCIDHGTGVVIGETTVIGDHVKIYQGVTLGALSVDKKDAVKKRHPTISDNTVIYAGATILGGETHIGHDSIIGGNVWLTQSIPPFSKIYYQAQMTNTSGETDKIIFKGESA